MRATKRVSGAGMPRRWFPPESVRRRWFPQERVCVCSRRAEAVVHTIECVCVCSRRAEAVRWLLEWVVLVAACLISFWCPQERCGKTPTKRCGKQSARPNALWETKRRDLFVPMPSGGPSCLCVDHKLVFVDHTLMLLCGPQTPAFVDNKVIRKLGWSARPPLSPARLCGDARSILTTRRLIRPAACEPCATSRSHSDRYSSFWKSALHVALRSRPDALRAARCVGSEEWQCGP
eukprot:363200-Chlamydomonas_euryale.AAC.1